MTREEAIKILKFQRGYFCDLKGCEEHQAFTMAIKALEQEPCEEEKRMITIDMEMPRCCIGCPILRESEGWGAYCPFVCEENNINIKQRTDRPSDCPLKEGD